MSRHGNSSIFVLFLILFQVSIHGPYLQKNVLPLCCRLLVKVPVGLAIFPEEISTVPRPLAESKYRVTNFFSKLAEFTAKDQLANDWTCLVEHKLYHPPRAKWM